MGLAADPDFTENLLMRYLPKSKIDEIYEKGVADIAWGEVSQDFFWCLEVVGPLTPLALFRGGKRRDYVKIGASATRWLAK